MSERPPGVHVVIKSTRNGKDCFGEPVWKYVLPKYVSFDLTKVDAMRRSAIVRRDEWLALQKEFSAKRDVEAAKFCKAEATDALKEYRAACLVLGLLLCEPPGDCPERQEWDWPVELASWLDRVVMGGEA